MMTIHTILYPTDFSTTTDHAYEVAAALASDYEATLLILHAWQRSPVVYCRAGAILVADPENVRTKAEANLNAWLSPALGIRVERLLVEGDACEAILRVAESQNCDLIVMGTHGRTGLDRIVLGSVAEHVLRRAPCPVLTVRAPAGGDRAAAPACAKGRGSQDKFARRTESKSAV